MSLVQSTISFTPPTTREDGSVLLPEDIASYKLVAGTAPDSLNTTINTVFAPATTITGNFDDEFGWYASVLAVDTTGRVSQPTEVVYIDPAPAAPSSPTNLAVV